MAAQSANMPQELLREACAQLLPHVGYRGVDPNPLCSDQDQGPDSFSYVHSDLDPALEPYRIRTNSDPDPTNFFVFFSK